MKPKPDVLRMAGKTVAILAEFRAHPLTWIGVHRLAQVGGYCAWRSRVSDARQVIEQAGEGTIEWNGDVKESQYRYLPYVPLGRDADTTVEQKSLF